METFEWYVERAVDVKRGVLWCASFVLSPANFGESLGNEAPRTSGAHPSVFEVLASLLMVFAAVSALASFVHQVASIALFPGFLPWGRSTPVHALSRNGLRQSLPAGLPTARSQQHTIT